MYFNVFFFIKRNASLLVDIEWNTFFRQQIAIIISPKS